MFFPTGNKQTTTINSCPENQNSAGVEGAAAHGLRCLSLSLNLRDTRLRHDSISTYYTKSAIAINLSDPDLL